MRTELDEVSVYVAKNPEQNITMCEKMTQTDYDVMDRQRLYSEDESLGGGPPDYKTTPNGTSPCNHPSLSCQVSLQLLVLHISRYFNFPSRNRKFRQFPDREKPGNREKVKYQNL